MNCNWCRWKKSWKNLRVFFRLPEVIDKTLKHFSHNSICPGLDHDLECPEYEVNVLSFQPWISVDFYVFMIGIKWNLLQQVCSSEAMIWSWIPRKKEQKLLCWRGPATISQTDRSVTDCGTKSWSHDAGKHGNESGLEPRTKIYCALEGQQQFTRPIVISLWTNFGLHAGRCA
jgi:hypothetical protein